MSKLEEYLRDTRGELKHVSWPTRNQTIAYTVIVIVVAVALSLFLGLFDFLFTRLIEFFII